MGFAFKLHRSKSHNGAAASFCCLFVRPHHKSPLRAPYFVLVHARTAIPVFVTLTAEEKALKARKFAGLIQNSDQLLTETQQVLKSEARRQGESRAAKQRGMGLCRNRNENKEPVAEESYGG